METDTETEEETKKRLEKMFGTPFQECPCVKCSEKKGRSDCKCEEFDDWHNKIDWQNLEKKVLELGEGETR
jgi:hypothetical protein